MDELLKKTHPVGIDAEVPVKIAGGARPEQKPAGQRTAGEIEGPVAAVKNHLDHIGVGGDFRVGELAGRGRHDHLRVSAQGCGQLADELRGKDRLVPLDVDHHVSRGQLQKVRRLGQAVAARGMVGPGHHRLAPETLHAVPDARVVGDHPKSVQSLNGAGPAHRPAESGAFPQWAPEACRETGWSRAGRDKGENLHKYFLLFMFYLKYRKPFFNFLQMKKIKVFVILYL